MKPKYTVYEKMFAALLLAIIVGFLVFAACSDIPKAEAPPVIEQQKHAIRFLGTSEGSLSHPNVYIIEVDGKRLVAVCNNGCGVLEMK